MHRRSPGRDVLEAAHRQTAAHEPQSHPGAETPQAEREPDRQQGELPPADFRALVGTLASQAIMGLGALADPKTGQRRDRDARSTAPQRFLKPDCLGPSPAVPRILADRLGITVTETIRLKPTAQLMAMAMSRNS